MANIKDIIQDKYKIEGIDNELLLQIQRYEKNKTSQEIAKIYAEYHKNMQKVDSLDLFYPDKKLITSLLQQIVFRNPTSSDKEILRLYDIAFQKQSEYYQKFYSSKEPFLQCSINKDMVTYFKQLLEKYSHIRHFCNRIQSGNFTSKINPKTGLFYASISSNERHELLTSILQMDYILQKIKYPLFPDFFVYRCVKLPQNEKKDCIFNLLATSWSYEPSYAEYWCYPKNYKLNRIILKVNIRSCDSFILNTMNESQFEVILLPCLLYMKHKKDFYVSQIVQCQPYFFKKENLGFVFQEFGDRSC